MRIICMCGMMDKIVDWVCWGYCVVSGYMISDCMLCEYVVCMLVSSVCIGEYMLYDRGNLWILR